MLIPGGMMTLTEKEISALHERMEKLAADNVRLRRELSAVRRRLATTERAARLDPLTNAHRREAFITLVNQDISAQRKAPGGKGNVLLFLDLIAFKEANERYGHVQADKILGHLVKVLYSQGTIRLYDETTVPEYQHTVGRYGGDEFLIYCRDASIDDARTIALRVKTRCEQETIPLLYHPRDRVFGIDEPYRPRLHAVAVWWPHGARGVHAEDAIRAGGEVISEAKTQRHDETHVTVHALKR